MKILLLILEGPLFLSSSTQDFMTTNDDFFVMSYRQRATWESKFVGTNLYNKWKQWIYIFLGLPYPKPAIILPLPEIGLIFHYHIHEPLKGRLLLKLVR